MADCKRVTETISFVEASSGATMSKKRKARVSSCELQLRSLNVEFRESHLLEECNDTTFSSASSANSAGTLVSGEFFSDQFPSSCCSSNETGELVKDSATPLDLEAKGFVTVDSTFRNIKLFRDGSDSLSEFSGDSDEVSFPAKSSAVTVSERRKYPPAKMPPKAEIEEFFTMAEKYEQKRFAEKYNYDIVKDTPLEGRYQWVRLN
ncbi:hypothetical protein L6164_035657 [Bauhinia variegata]|uniref:Uncharacterized protein n=1 Tax=Bauhinia variegata TaxID=167791 RepID=A0ACB9KEN8_BAUVA|nr:hypothetical protein L6164_035657 [Bauhinia variegata]